MGGAMDEDVMTQKCTRRGDESLVQIYSLAFALSAADGDDGDDDVAYFGSAPSPHYDEGFNRSASFIHADPPTSQSPLPSRRNAAPADVSALATPPPVT
jgi:hypothetical protein